MSYVSMAGLAVAVDQLLALGATRIEAHSNRLAAILTEELSALGWDPFRASNDAAASSHIVSIAHPGRSDEVVNTALNEHDIVCGTRGGRIRVSLAPYNDESDVRRLVEALGQGG
jgi:selenocysteine lyase/cysteine desulfurase